MHQKKREGIEELDALILLQHTDVYTLGKAASIDNVITEEARQHMIRVERGGEVTYHGPGQLVAYPILDLSRHKKDLRWFVRSIEEVVILALNDHGIRGERSSINSGVWVGLNKISAVGISASRWTTMHGAAVNVSCDMSKFSSIVPCGVREEGCGVTSVAELAPGAGVSVQDMGDAFSKRFAEVFSLRLDHRDERELVDAMESMPTLRDAKPG